MAKDPQNVCEGKMMKDYLLHFWLTKRNTQNTHTHRTNTEHTHTHAHTNVPGLLVGSADVAFLVERTIRLLLLRLARKW